MINEHPQEKVRATIMKRLSRRGEETVLYIYIYIYRERERETDIYIYIYIYIYTYIYIYIYIHTYIHTYIIHMCIYVYLFIYMHVCMHACMYVCMHVCRSPLAVQEGASNFSARDFSARAFRTPIEPFLGYLLFNLPSASAQVARYTKRYVCM